MSWRKAVRYGVLAVAMGFVAIWMDLTLLIGTHDILRNILPSGGRFTDPPEWARILAHAGATAVTLVVGALLMVWGFRHGWTWIEGQAQAEKHVWGRGRIVQGMIGGLPEASGLLGASMWAFLGYVDNQPEWWTALAPFLLPWALLLVDLDPRHRIVLLAVQWLGSAMMLEVWTGGVATVSLLTLALLHALAVWATLPDARLRVVPTLVGAAIAVASLGTTIRFMLLDATWQRGVVAAACLFLLAGFTWLALTRRLERVRIPTLVRRPAETR